MVLETTGATSENADNEMALLYMDIPDMERNRENALREFVALRGDDANNGNPILTKIEVKTPEETEENL